MWWVAYSPVDGPQIVPGIAERLPQVWRWSVLFSKFGKTPRKSSTKPTTARRVPTSRLERFIAECGSALATGDMTWAVRPMMECAVSAPDAIRVYRRDFVSRVREEWDPETLCTQPYGTVRTSRLLEDSTPRAVRGGPGRGALGAQTVRML